MINYRTIAKQLTQFIRLYSPLTVEEMCPVTLSVMCYRFAAYDVALVTGGREDHWDELICSIKKNDVEPKFALQSSLFKAGTLFRDKEVFDVFDRVVQVMSRFPEGDFYREYVQLVDELTEDYCSPARRIGLFNYIMQLHGGRYIETIPQEVGALVGQLLRKALMYRGGLRLYDPACGVASLALTAWDRNSGRFDKLVLREASMLQTDMARLSMFVNGIKQYDLKNEDFLREMAGETDFPRGLYDHGRYPFVFDSLFPVEGSPCGYGYIDLCRSAQTQIDMLQTAFVKNTMVGAVPRYFQRADGAVNEEEFLNLNNPIVHVSGNLGEDSLRIVDYRPLSGNYLEMRASVINELRETSGNTETSVGLVNAGVTAASAIAALQEASGKGSRDSTRESYRVYGEMIELCIELIRQFYDLPRQFRITGALGLEQFVSYDNHGLRPQALYGPEGMDLGMRRPVFDIRVVPQKSSAYTRMSQNELALQFYQLGFFSPERSDQALACMSMMEFEGKDELMQQLFYNGNLQKELALYQQYALAMTQKYEPERSAALMAGITGRATEPKRGRVRTESGREDRRMEKARARASGAGQPGGGR